MSTSVLLRLFAFAFLVGTAAPLSAQEAGRDRARSAAEAQIRNRVNDWTVTLAAGLLEGAPIRFATELARAVESDRIHVLPVVTRGPTENVNDLLYLRGIDLGIINGDSLDEYRTQVPQIGSRIVQILDLFPSELHVFVRPGIGSLAELAGKKVNFNTKGTAAAYSGPLIFSRLGVEVEQTFIPHPVALERLRRGELDAVVFVTAKPIDAFVKGKWEGGYRFLPVEYGPKLADYYVPARLDPADYPALVAPGETVSTVAVPTVLVSYNWRVGSARYQRVARFVEELFDHADRLRTPGFDPKWKELDLAAAAPGMERFAPAREWLAHHQAVLRAGGPGDVGPGAKP